MSITPIRSGAVQALSVETQQATTRRRDEVAPDRSANRSAIRVELSPAARAASASSAVTTSNRSAAASSDFFASAEGSKLLSALGPASPRAAVRL